MRKKTKVGASREKRGKRRRRGTRLTACSLTPPGTTSPLAGLTGRLPEQKTSPFATIACAVIVRVDILKKEEG